MSRNLSPLPAPAVLTYATCAHYIGLPSANALRQMVCRKTAPPSFQYGKRDVRFLRSIVDAWLAAKSGGAIIEAVAPPPVKRGRGRPTKAEVIARRPR
jgi:hypothetical protein